jgi:hypothetical protein
MRGGKRQGAGRKKGATAVKTREIADRAMAEGITPLEVMLGAMRCAWENGDKEKAASHAKDAAPYMHPRLAAIEHSGDADNPVAHAIMTGVPHAPTDNDDQRPAAQSH